MKHRIVISVLSSLFVLVLLFLMFYFISMDKVILICDKSFVMNIPDSEIKSSRKGFRKQGLRLKTVEVDYSETIDTINKYYNVKAVILSPVCAAEASLNQDKVEYHECSIIAMELTSDYAEKDTVFDVVLTADESRGWEQANKTVPTGSVVLKNPVGYVFDFSEANSDKFVLDYRYSKIVPAERLLGIVCPAIYESTAPYLFEKEENCIEGVLLYEFVAAE